MNHTDAPEDEVLWGRQVVADAINAKLRKTFHLLENGHLPADKVGAQWTSTRGRLRRFFAGETNATIAPTPRPTPKPTIIGVTDLLRALGVL
jgi:hypothetical protein